jgi:hypothetical protein
VVRAGTGQAYIPLEFADAAFRYGHGQIRHTYRLVDGGPAVPLFPDLIGFGPLPTDRHLDLTQIFDMPGHPPAQSAKRLDGRLAASLIGLPEQVTGTVDDNAHRSLAVRELLRGETTRLPSGETIADLIGADPLTADELDRTWPHSTPLWFYILKEAEHRGGGDRLGPVGGPIVAEVLIGLLRADPLSYRADTRLRDHNKIDIVLHDLQAPGTSRICACWARPTPTDPLGYRAASPLALHGAVDDLARASNHSEQGVAERAQEVGRLIFVPHDGQSDQGDDERCPAQVHGDPTGLSSCRCSSADQPDQQRRGEDWPRRGSVTPPKQTLIRSMARAVTSVIAATTAATAP